MHVAIVGAGIAGLTTAWELTRRGHRVTILEQATQIPNPLAASGDQHRIIRRGYGSADGYAALLTEAYDAWEALWRDLGQRHYVETGVLTLSQRPGDEADDIRAGYDRMGVRYDRLTPDEAAARFAFVDPDRFDYATLTPEGGALLCQRIAAGLLDFLARRGAVVHPGARVTSVDPTQGIVVTADGQTVRADRIVVACGGWTGRLLPEFAPTLVSKRTHVGYVEPPADLAPAWAAAPVILSIGGDSEAWSISPVAGTGLKFGSGLLRHDGGPDDDEPGTPDIARRLLASMSPVLARLGEYRVRELRSCVYTYTADKCFFGDQVDRLTVVSACSGHGYKFAAAVGRQVAEAVINGDAARLRRWLRAEILPAAA